jgi:uncharacterized protein YdeI (YjbR/CyaY-like superfamily)
MIKEDKAIDAYIAKSAGFAKPILLHIRALVHKACPDVEEKVKWGMPHFDYKAGPLCHMASFKQHAAMGFWKAALMKDPVLIENAKSETAMGHLGKITSLKDMPSDKKIIAWIKEAMVLNDKGIKLSPKSKPADKKELVVPDYFTKALAKNKKAKQVFENFAPSHRKEYLMWITEAKTEETRNKRMETALEWIAQGKGRNWKYEKK